MADLTEFSRILIFKDTPEIRGIFGEPYPAPNVVSVVGPKFYGSFPSDNLLTDSTWQPILQRNLLHAMGVEESSTLGFNRSPVSSGTAIIFGDKMYQGSNTTINYTGIVANSTDVTVSGSGFPTILDGTQVQLSNVSPITGLGNPTYYAYNASSTSFKLAASLTDAIAGDAITTASGTNTSGGTASLTSGGYEFNQTTDFVIPTPPLFAGDYIFWGEDPNGLKIGGKIKTVYGPESPEYAQGAIYQFEKETTEPFPIVDSNIVPQDIYYYRRTWNGKGQATDITKGFYVLIGVELNAQAQRAYFPWLDPNGSPSGASSEKRIIDVTTQEKYAYTDLIRVKRISSKFKSDQTGFQNEPGGITEEIIPCTIRRTNTFWWDDSNRTTSTSTSTSGSGSTGTVTTGELTSFFTLPNSAQMPPFIAYHVNPYGDGASKLDKNTTYVVEISERLPALVYVATAKDTVFFNFVNTGTI